MNPRALRILTVYASLASAAALLGCGGGGGGTADTMKPVDPPPEPPTPSLTVPAGMSASAAPGVRASGAGDTIAALLPDASRQFAPVSARSLSDEFHVRSISSDGNGGLRVTYAIAGRERTVHFAAEDFGTSQYPWDFYKETPDGGRFWLWSRFGSFTGDEKNQGSARFRYFDIYGSSVSGYGGYNRLSLSFGARTDAANLPAGTAIYSGFMTSDHHPVGNARSGATRGIMIGDWRLTADFGESTLSGDIRRLQSRAPGESEYRLLPLTTYFRIENGQIVDGRFTASVSGVDSNAGAPPSRTVKGFEGDVLGEFYGPGAEEAGGVIRAVRQSDQRVVGGKFGGQRAPVLAPSIPDGELSLLSVAIDRDFANATVARTTRAAVTAIESDGAGGFRVSYRVDGVDRQVHVERGDYGLSGTTWGYTTGTAEGGLFYLSDNTGSFTGNPEFNHFNVHQWGPAEYSADGILQSISGGFVAYGVATAPTDLPAGSATYAGRMHAQSWRPDSPSYSTRNEIDGRLTLNADFGASTVDGVIDQITSRYGTPLTSVAIENGAIQGGDLTANLRAAEAGATFEGTMRGRFFGPGAAEVGGVLDGSYSDSQVSGAVARGWFGAAKQ